MEEKKVRVLRDRARKLAQRPSCSDGTFLEVLAFRLGEERYAVGSLHVGEVFPLREMTPLPCTPPFVAGIVNLRGQILSVVDLKVFFDIPGPTSKSFVVVIRSPSMEMGLLVEPPVEVRLLPLADITPPPAVLSGLRGACLVGLAQGLALLDGACLLREGAFRVE